jgi:hypothetical protein
MVAIRILIRAEDPTSRSKLTVVLPIYCHPAASCRVILPISTSTRPHNNWETLSLPAVCGAGRSEQESLSITTSTDANRRKKTPCMELNYVTAADRRVVVVPSRERTKSARRRRQHSTIDVSPCTCGVAAGVMKAVKDGSFQSRFAQSCTRRAQLSHPDARTQYPGIRVLRAWARRLCNQWPYASYTDALNVPEHSTLGSEYCVHGHGACATNGPTLPRDPVLLLHVCMGFE